MEPTQQQPIDFIGEIGKVDWMQAGDVGFRVTTASEVSMKEYERFLMFRNSRSRVLLVPDGADATAELAQVEGKEGKSQSQRIRNALYRLWEYERAPDESFDNFYHAETEAILGKIMDRLRNY